MPTLNKYLGTLSTPFRNTRVCMQVKLVVLNKESGATEVGIRTKDKTAKAGKDYHAITEDKQKLIFGEKEEEQDVFIDIVDDNQWTEDREFSIELFDLKTGIAFE